MFTDIEIPFWYASFVFLGLSLSVGILIFILNRDRKRRRLERERKNQLYEMMKKPEEKGKVSTIESLEQDLKERENLEKK